MRRLVLSLAILAISSPAWARSERTLAYPRDQAWSASVRFLRVDEQLKIIEKDPEAGYVLFELSAENKVFRGSLELIAVTEDERPSLKFVIQIQDRPSWVEGAMLTRLVRKLHVELGEPAPPPTPKPPKDEPKPKEPEPKPG
ncbi:MAG TPA: hypothetical protein VGO00_13420, partial [Kofleriaceae bacterium]|nr:hypothetical protein [Kofleriaceae bacterium]